MEQKSSARSFGVFKPTGHLVVSFPQAEQADRAFGELAERGLPTDEIRRCTDREMIEQIDADLADASPLASIGQEKNLVKAHRALAEQGYHWLIIPAANPDRAREIADCVGAFGAERAQFYGRFVIEELLEHGDEQPQVAESPDRELDSQTPSGSETERATIRPAPPAADRR